MTMTTTTAPTREDLRFAIPTTVSSEATDSLARIFSFYASQPEQAPATSLADWDLRRDRLEEVITPIARQVAERLGVSTEDDNIGGVAVVRLRPRDYRPDGRTLIYIHGGGYVVFSARSALIIPALIASATGDEVVSIDYTLAPRGTWRTVTQEVVAVWRGLLTTGRQPAAIGLFGDSAGGGLAAGSVLRMRDEGLPLPGALVLLSPWSDITDAGDTYRTLDDVDPSLTLENLSSGAAVYASSEDQRHPYVSPVYGDYAKAFPPTLIQGGTREMFLSNFVRQYQAIRSGGHEAILDLYEGMPHVFQGLAPDSPETRTAVKRAGAFFDEHL